MIRTKVALAVLALVFGVSTTLADGHLAPSTTNTESLYFFANGSDAGGLSHLTRTNGMIVATLEPKYLVPGDVYTLWVLVFNRPGNCSDDCGEDDIFNEDGTLNVNQVLAVGLAIGGGSGNVAKSDGTLEFGARVVKDRDHFGEDGHMVLFGDGFGPIMLTSSPHDAEVHFIVQSHGQARGGPPLLRQLSEVDTNCTPFCNDVQFAVHKP